MTSDKRTNQRPAFHWSAPVENPTPSHWLIIIHKYPAKPRARSFTKKTETVTLLKP
jgi:hypothetical protein